MKNWEQFNESNNEPLIIGNIYRFNGDIVGIYIGKRLTNNNSVVFIEISDYFENTRKYNDNVVDAFSEFPPYIDMNMTSIEFILEDGTRYNYIKTAKCRIGADVKKLFNNYMKELNKDNDIKIIIDSEEIGLL